MSEFFLVKIFVFLPCCCVRLCLVMYYLLLTQLKGRRNGQLYRGTYMNPPASVWLDRLSRFRPYDHFAFEEADGQAVVATAGKWDK